VAAGDGGLNRSLDGSTPERRPLEPPATASALRLEAIVTGRVQGVGFRWFARDRALALGLTGWVRNRADGSLEVVAQGPAVDLDRFERVLREGPPGAEVRAMQAMRSAAVVSEGGFIIRGSEHRGD
jgi:acylphosphatase